MSEIILNSEPALQSFIGELWRDVPGYVGVLQASNHGRIRTVERRVPTCYGAMRTVRQRVVAQRPGKMGYVRLAPSYGGTALAHRLVALAWVPNPNQLPVINHIDGIKHNNHPSNLEWCTQERNVQHALDMGLAAPKRPGKGDDSPASKLTSEKVAEIKRRLAAGERSIDLSRMFGVTKGAIGEIKAGRAWGHIRCP